MTLTAELGIKRRDDPLAYQAAWRERNREKNNAYHRDYYHTKTKQDPAKLRAKLESGTWTRRKKKYGVTRERYHEMLAEQKGCCYICGEYHGKALVVDHDHTSGDVRRLLCMGCNAALGQMREDPRRLRAAAEYLEQHRNRS